MRPLTPSLSLLILLQCLLTCHAFHRGSSRSLFSYNNAGDRIQKSFQNNYRNYWHFPGMRGSMFGPSQPSVPAVTTSNARDNTRPGVDPGLVTSRASPRVDPAQWSQVVPSRLASPPAQLARLQWPRFSPGVGDTMLTGQMADRPQVTWSGGRPGELYTIMILDEVRNIAL